VELVTRYMKKTPPSRGQIKIGPKTASLASNVMVEKILKRKILGLRQGRVRNHLPAEKV